MIPIHLSYIFNKLLYNFYDLLKFPPIFIIFYRFSFPISCFPCRSSHCRWLGLAECAERSAALVVDKARRVEPKPKVQIANLKSADHKPPSYLPPAHLRIPPGHPKPTVRLILWFSKNNSHCRARSKKLRVYGH